MSAIDTIFAVASGAGVSALSVIRLSGSRSSDALRSLSGRVGEARKLIRRRLVDPTTGLLLDDALVVWMPSPHSYTGEDSAELHIHGSRAVQVAVLSALGRCPGLRLAEAGEFTRRAVLNGKLDLVAAEGLGDLLVARTESQRKQALAQVAGQSTSSFDSWRERLVSIRASVEAAIDFADEDGVAEQATIRVENQIQSLIQEMETAAALSRSARAIRDGIHVVLAGQPNTGKSSLINVLAGRDAAIVSDSPGTTRDIIEVFIDVGGYPVILKDTAGMRDRPTDVVEIEGVRRSWQALLDADLVVWVSAPDIPGSTNHSGVSPDIVVSSKCDLDCGNNGLARNDLGDVPFLSVSAQTQEGIEHLIATIHRTIRNKYYREEPFFIVSQRQRDITDRAIMFLRDSVRPDLPLEVKAVGIHSAAVEIGRITGRTDVEEWLGAIFSRFCIGK